MTIIEAMTADLMDKRIITGLKYWAKGNCQRTYIRVAGYDPGYRGCKTHHLYWDHKTRQLVDQRGPGIAPNKYNIAVEQVLDAFTVIE